MWNNVAVRSGINPSSFDEFNSHVRTRCNMYTSCCWNCNFIFGTIIRKFVREYGSTEQFEKNYRSARGPRETFATNWLPGYPRATVLRTCSPLLRRRNFVKSPELLRIMRTTSLSLSLSKLSLISNCFQSSPPPPFACDRNLKRRVSQLRELLPPGLKMKKGRKKVGIQWHYRGKKGRMGYSPLR